MRSTPIALKSLATLALAGVLSTAALAEGRTVTFTIPGAGGASATGAGYMLGVHYSRTRVNLESREVQVLEESKPETRIGPFDFSGDSVARFNVNFQNSRKLAQDEPETYRLYRVSCYSIRQSETHVKVMVHTERMVQGEWKNAGFASATLPVDTDRFEVGAIPMGHDFQETPGTVEFIELAISATRRD